MPSNKEIKETTEVSTDLVSEAKLSINKLTDSTKALMDKKKELEDEISVLNNRINELFNMPLNIDDYCSYIPDYVKACGKSTYGAIRGKKETTWGNCENEEGKRFENTRLVSDAEGIYFGDLRLTTFHRECFYNPEGVIKQLTQALKEKYKDNWGNNDLPSVAERRIEVNELISKREETQKELNEVNADINNIRDELISMKLIETKQNNHDGDNADSVVYDYLRRQGMRVNRQ